MGPRGSGSACAGVAFCVPGMLRQVSGWGQRRAFLGEHFLVTWHLRVKWSLWSLPTQPGHSSSLGSSGPRPLCQPRWWPRLRPGPLSSLLHTSLSDRLVPFDVRGGGRRPVRRSARTGRGARGAPPWPAAHLGTLVSWGNTASLPVAGTPRGGEGVQKPNGGPSHHPCPGDRPWGRYLYMEGVPGRHEPGSGDSRDQT